MTKPIRIVVVGATGKMGQTLIQEIVNDNELLLSGAIDAPSCSFIGSDSGSLLGLNTGVLISESLSEEHVESDILIDFTRPEASLVYLDFCIAHGINYVLGTTGFNEDEKERIYAAAKKIAICFAPNMSVGVNLLISLVEAATKVLHNEFDIEIIEAHHRHKVDSPSGTALRLGEVVAKSAGLSLKENSIFHREGNIAPRKAKEIGFSTIRGGDIVGDHTVLFAGDGERVELTHKASSRKTFAKGAIRASKFITGKNSGLFDILDVLNLKNID
ncbi:MAG: 4-hydroxy-tetrahydrodipicolinate reductase [Methylophilaceae bacterium]|nr:4-hydroxy-tetrahydrodipicolinate reductase [Methylophilaceae bacterium]